MCMYDPGKEKTLQNFKEYFIRSAHTPRHHNRAMHVMICIPPLEPHLAPIDSDRGGDRRGKARNAGHCLSGVWKATITDRIFCAGTKKLFPGVTDIVTIHHYLAG